VASSVLLAVSIPQPHFWEILSGDGVWWRCSESIEEIHIEPVDIFTVWLIWDSNSSVAKHGDILDIAIS
jgi:hypothetical protein